MTENIIASLPSEPAFPIAFPDSRNDDYNVAYGMTMRDYFAAKAMKTYSDDTDELLLENAIRAYKQADAMIKARQA